MDLRALGRGAERISLALLSAALIVVALTGCTAMAVNRAQERPATSTEQAILQRAIDSLSPLLNPRCEFRVVINGQHAKSMNVILAQEMLPCVLIVRANPGFLGAIPEDEVLAALAHEVGHFLNGDLYWSVLRKRRDRLALPSQQRETEADRTAARLLMQIGGQDTCFALPHVLVRFQDVPNPTHPMSSERVRNTEAACEALAAQRTGH
jgi:hypothetical protein